MSPRQAAQARPGTESAERWGRHPDLERGPLPRTARDAPHPLGAQGSKRRPILRRVLRLLGRAGLIGLAVLAGGFVAFTGSVADLGPPADPRADGIVVLTGGRDRIPAAMALLAEGRAKRLLISGVHPGTTAEDIGKGGGMDSALFHCCVDLGYAAENTAGNAAEARAWATRHRFPSLILVTSTYHLPRSMAELKRAMPGIEITAYPVRHADLSLESWWRDAAAWRVLAGEYAKYLVAQMRLPGEVLDRIGHHQAAARARAGSSGRPAGVPVARRPDAV